MAPPGDITFRTASASDIPAIQDLSSRIWREHYPGIISHAQIDYMLGRMYAADVIRDEIGNKGYRYVLVTSGDEAVGYIAYRFEAPNATVLSGKLYLLPSLHGKGIGRRMLQSLTMGPPLPHSLTDQGNRGSVARV